MGIKAERGTVIEYAHREEDFDVQGGLDEMVMVLFPRVTWDAVQDLARKTGTAPGEMMSIALKLLETKVNEEAKKMKDGS